MEKKTIGILVGSLRKDSFNKKIAHSLAKLFPENFTTEFIEIGNLEWYNQDLDDENRPTENWTAFREKLKNIDAFVFVTAEYNRSVPAVLKNALDVGSRPYGSSIWDGKPAFVVSSSTGAISGFGANHHLRQSLVFLNMPTMPQPEAYIAYSNKLFDDNGTLVNQGTQDFFQLLVDSFVDWMGKFN